MNETAINNCFSKAGFTSTPPKIGKKKSNYHFRNYKKNGENLKNIEEFVKIQNLEDGLEIVNDLCTSEHPSDSDILESVKKS